MDEMNKVPEVENNKKLKEQETPTSESVDVSEPVENVPAPKASIPKLPFIIGGAVAGVAVIAVAVALILGGGKHEHSFGEWMTVDAPTCIAAGIEERVCECDDKEMRRIDALGHTEVIDSAVAPTCSSAGLTEGKYCSECGYVITVQEKLPTLAHSYDNKYDEDCNVCGYKRDAECAHTETVIVTGKPASCTATGLTDGTKCKKCGEIIVAQTTVPLNAHTEVVDVAVAATCTSTGLTVGKHCSVCSKIIVAQKTTAIINHIASDWIVDIKSTKIDDGARHKECTMCGITMVEEIIYAGSVGLAYEVSSYKESCTITGIGSCTDEEIVIPRYIDGYIVRDIGDNAFSRCTSLESITIPNTVVSIGYEAFLSCTNLASLTFHASVETIGGFAFSNCNSLRSVNYLGRIDNWLLIYLNSSHSNPLCNGADLYFNGELVTDIKIPYAVWRTSLNHSVFYGCTSLVNVKLPESIEEIGSFTFYRCTSLKSITIPNSVTSIGSYAFSGCISLEKINYGGAPYQFSDINKGEQWADSTGDFEVYCYVY